MEDLVTGFIAVGVACVLIIDLATQVRVNNLTHKIDQIIAKIGK